MTATLLKKTSTQVFSCEYCEIFKSTYFEKHLRTAASETLLVNSKLFMKVLIGFEFFTKIHSKRKAWNSQKIKERVKNVIIMKKVSCESSSSLNLVYDSFILELWY